MATNKPLGIVLTAVQMLKNGRLSQFVEWNSEPFQWLLSQGWKPGKTVTFVEVSDGN